MTCIIHYEEIQKYDKLSVVTERIAERILLAKRMHEDSNDDHMSQCEAIPSSDLTQCSFHRNPCYNKFVKITSKSNEISTKNPTTVSSKSSLKTRSKRKSSTKLQKLPPTRKRPKKQPATPQVRRRGTSLLATTSSRNKFVFGKECVVCGKYELRYKNKNREEVREYPLLLTLDAPAEKIQNMLQKKEKYKELKEKIVLTDLISAEFKYHDRCRKDIMREDRETSIVGRKVAGFEKVTDYIDDYVFKMNQVVSMKVIYDICYGKECDDLNKEAVAKRKQRLKSMIQDYYGEKLIILGTRANYPEVLIHSKNLDSEVTLKSNQESMIKGAAKFLRNDIIDFCTKLPPLSWPPMLEELLCEERLPPPSTILFLNTLLKSPKHAVTDRIRRLVDSFSADFVYGVSGGKVLTGKHYLFAHGLHCMTGNKEAVKITNRFGHCDTYDNLLDIETAQAQKAVKLMSDSNTSVLPLQPKSDEDTVITVFWADNFDKNVDKETGGGAINITTIMAFQENSDGAVSADRKISVPKTRSRKVTVDFGKHDVVFYDKQEPCTTSFERIEEDSSVIQSRFSCRFFMWLYLRYSNRFEQVHPTLSGMLLRLRQKELVKDSTKVLKTVETYLPPLTTKVTDPQTIYSYLTYFQLLAKEMNMPYVNVTLDVGAAINAFKLLWKYSQQFSNVIIHLGDFHVMKENFKVMGLLVQCSGFEEIVYQARMCTSGSLSGVMTGGHYNRAWRIHEVMFEAFERILYKRFLNEVQPNISDELHDLASEESDLVSLESMQCGEPLRLKFNDYQQNVRGGYLGKTAQFWLIYIETMRNQLQYHISVQENDFQLRLLSIESFIPLYFYYNMHNYARYASYYVQVMKCIDKNYPGLREMFTSTGISVQSQDRYPLRTAIDMRGEQTLNKDAKTSGGVTQFASSLSSVQKWAMNRSDAAETRKALREMTGLSDSNTIYKSLRPRQIINSEHKVTEVMDVIENRYINPFGLDVDKDNLVNISSGTSLPQNVADEVLNQLEKGKELAEDFTENRIFSSNKKFHKAITKNDCKSFNNSKKSCIVRSKKSDAQATVEVNRNILGALNSFSLKTGIAVDYKKALEYPLNPSPLSICHADGRKRSNQKSDLKNILLNPVKKLSFEEVKDICSTAVVVDMMGLVNNIKPIPDTYEELAKLFVAKLPKGYRRIDVVADCYRSVRLFKNGVDGNQSDKILIPSLHSRVHPEYVLKNRENKARLIELIFEYIKNEALHCFEMLNSQEIVLSSEDECVKIQLSESCVTVDPYPELFSSQDEGDTKVILHASKILDDDSDAVVTIRSPSGDTDIVIIMIGLLHKYGERVILDDFHGDNRKSYRLSDIELDDDVIDALIGFHAFTGNDFTSSFFRKGKNTCFKLLDSSSRFKAAFAQLGSSWELSDDTFDVLQSFVVRLYGIKKNINVNEARYKMFSRKFGNEEKTVDMSVLPPCESVLRLHCERANYLAANWKNATISRPGFPDTVHHGWNIDRSITWVVDIFPDDVELILLDNRYDPNDVNDAHGESEDEE